MPLPPTNRSMSSDKALPSLPAGGLGLDFSGLPRDDARFGLGLELNPKSSKPPPTHFIPLRQSPLHIEDLPLSSPSIISLSPSTPIASSSYPFPYTNENRSNSTIMGRSTSTLIPMNTPIPSSPSISISTAPPDLSFPRFVTPKKKIEFGKSSTSADSIRSEMLSTSATRKSPLKNGKDPQDTSNTGSKGASLGRKRSSGQLLMGIGKGLNRVGSVMRRKTSEGVEGSASTPRKLSGGTWRKGRRRKTDDWQEGWEKVNNTDEGDAGIGRPFNVGHDLHVSPDLSDLPEQWLSSLRQQGLSESDLLLISAARQKQHETHRLPLRSTSKIPQAPLSAPPSRILHGSFSSNASELLNIPSSDPSSSKGLLKKFSFENSSPTTPTIKDGLLTESIPTISSSELKLTIPPIRRRGRESFPVSASGSSDLNHEVIGEQEDVFNSQLPNVTTERLISRPRPKKRFSSQLQVFRESTFGLGEDDEGEWGRSILDSTWLTSSNASSTSKGKMKEDAIPIPPEPSSSSHTPIKKQVSKSPSLEMMPKSPPPPARPRKTPSVTLQPNQAIDLPALVDDGPRQSSESFGVHYNTRMAKSKSSVESVSELITPSASMEQGVDVKERDGSDGNDLEESDDEEGDRDNTRHPYAQTHLKDQSALDEDMLNHPFTQNKFLDREDLMRRYHPNPHLTLPATAIDSRSTTPEPHPPMPIPTDPISNLHLSPSATSRRISIKQQTSYSTFDSTPYKSFEDEDDLLNKLDRANPEERASIALSILSSRTSTSMQSLHELSHATVGTAYKLAPVGETNERGFMANPNPKHFLDGHHDNHERNVFHDNERNSHPNHPQAQSHPNPKTPAPEDNSECGSISVLSTSAWGSEENEGEAKDAMEALGEAARRLRSV